MSGRENTDTLLRGIWKHCSVQFIENVIVRKQDDPEKCTTIRHTISIISSALILNTNPFRQQDPDTPQKHACMYVGALGIASISLMRRNQAATIASPQMPCSHLS